MGKKQTSQIPNILLSVKDASAAISVSTKMVRLLIASGRLKAVNLGKRMTRISLQELTDFAQGQGCYVVLPSSFLPFNNDKREKNKKSVTTKPETGSVNKTAKCRVTPASDKAPEGVTHDSHYTLAEVMNKFNIKYGRFYEVRNRFQLPSVHAWGTTAFRKEDVEETIAKYNEEQGKAQAKARPTIQKFVGHISLSFSPDNQEKLDDEKIAEIAKEYMRRMGIVNTQYVVFRHFDQPHPHIHIVYNRVDNDGNGIKGDTSYTKSAAITKALTREYSLTFGKGKDKVRRERLKGKDAIKYRLFDNITAAVKESVTWDELRKLLAAKGISLDFVKDKDGNIRGVTFTDSKRNVTFAGSKIDRSLSFANIDKQMMDITYINDHQSNEPIQFIQEQENPFDINDAFDFSLVSGGTRQPSGDAVEQVTTPSDRSSSGSGIGEAIVDVLLQPNVAPVSSGGGGGASGGWRDDDDDDEKNKNSYKPRKRR